MILHEHLDQGRLPEFFQTRPEEMRAVMVVRGQRISSPIQVRYWSMSPYRLADRAIKFFATPISRTTNKPPAETGPDFKRDVMMEQLGEEDVYYKSGVQLQADPVSMPVEDPVVLWDETEAPF